MRNWENIRCFPYLAVQLPMLGPALSLALGCLYRGGLLFLCAGGPVGLLLPILVPGVGYLLVSHFVLFFGGFFCSQGLYGQSLL